MEDWIIYTIVSGVSIIIGIGVGVLLYKIKAWLDQKNIIKNAKEVLKCERKNQVELEGKVFEANKFKVRTDDGKVLLIDLKGGGKTEYEKEKVIKKNRPKPEGFKMEPYYRAPIEDSNGTGEEKRTAGTRLSRIRRRY